MLAMKFAPTLTVALILSLISLTQISLNFFKPIKAANVTNVSQLHNIQDEVNAIHKLDIITTACLDLLPPQTMVLTL